jgi:RNA polymerase sigma-70 factor (ECF subfamily)
MSSALVHTMALRSLRDPSRAEDVTEEVFQRAWRARENVDPEMLDVWITNIARDTVGQHARQRGEQLSNRMLDVVVVGGALRQLRPPVRDVVSMSFYLGLTQQDIADQLEISVVSVKHHLRHGLSKLQSQLETSDATSS